MHIALSFVNNMLARSIIMYKPFRNSMKPDISAFENSVVPDQLASEEANISVSTQFSPHHVSSS